MRTPVFFYGLFMDERFLRERERGLEPRVVGVAVLTGFRLHIGARATLVPEAEARCYGVLIELTPEETEVLYAPADVRDYRPQTVEVELLAGGERRAAVVYNLPAASSGASNAAYALKLAALVRELGLPDAYADEVAAFAAD